MPLANSTIVQGNSVMVAAPVEPTKKNPKYAGLTYIPQLTEQLSKQIKKFVPDLGIAPRPPEKVFRLFTDLKQKQQKLTPGQCSCVVYGIPCLNCNKWYYGETIWTLDGRIDEGHKKTFDTFRKTRKNEQL